MTEWRTGIDLVREQLRVAAGLPLSVTQEEVEFRGHAIEARISAEDPANRFLPASGTIAALREPSGPGVRVDSGLYDGMSVPLYYDPLLAKLICWGQDREQAIARMRRAIEEYTIAGVRTTLPFTAWILRHPRFISGDVSTDFIAEEWRPEELERLGSTISTENGAMTPETIAALASALAAQDQGAAAVAQRSPAGENSADGSRWRTAARRDGVTRGR